MSTKPDKIKKIRELDPLSEYYRECPYCEEKFMAHHQLQKFCPSKYNIPNYCKHRYKVLLQGARLAGENVVVSPNHSIAESPVSNYANKAFDGMVTPAAVNEYIAANPEVNEIKTTAGNNKILSTLMAKGKPTEFSLLEISNAGLDILTYDCKRKLPGCDLYFIEIGNYVLFWTHKNKILITNIAETLWI